MGFPGKLFGKYESEVRENPIKDTDLSKTEMMLARDPTKAKMWTKRGLFV
jgi:hypothetical protein